MSLDAQLALAINGAAGGSAALDWAMVQVGHAGLLWLPGLLLAGYWLWRDWREAVSGALTVAAVVGVGDLLGAQLKQLIQRPRPCHVLDGVQQLTGCGGAFSFPSNHALNTAAVAAFGQVLYPRSGWLAWPVVLLVGLSRVYVGAHYVTDVLGGWLIGGSLGAAAGLLFVRWRRVRSTLPSVNAL